MLRNCVMIIHVFLRIINKQTKTQHKSHTNHWPNLRKAETKRKKEFNLLEGKNATFLEAWEKETSNTVS